MKKYRIPENIREIIVDENRLFAISSKIIQITLTDWRVIETIEPLEEIK